MPVHNGMPHLRSAMESLQAQTLEDFECIVVDDGSTDDTAEYLQAIQDDRFHILHQENQGIVSALNRGLEEAQGTWIARLDADDVALPGFLRATREFLTANPQYRLVGTGYEFIGTSGRRTGLQRCIALRDPPSYTPKIDGNIQHSGAVFQREAVMAIGGYQDLTPGQDYDLWLRLSERHQLAVLDEVLVLYRISSEGISLSRFVEQRVNWAYALACADARLRSQPEPDHQAFCESHWPSGRDRRCIEAARHHRLAVGAWVNHRPVKALWHLACACALAPKYTLRKARSSLNPDSQ